MLVRIRNWRQFQHYRDRRPSWIKVHFQLLTSKDWVSASNSERVLALACMLIASQSRELDGRFEADPEYFRRVAYLHERPDFNPLIQRGFLEVLADASKVEQTLAEFRPETYKEETEKEKALRDFGVFWEAYPRKIDKQDAQKAFLRGKIDSHLPEVLASLEIWKQSEEWAEERYIPHAATFINRKRWTCSPARSKRESVNEQFNRDFEVAVKRVESSIRAQDRSGSNGRMGPPVLKNFSARTC